MAVLLLAGCCTATARAQFGALVSGSQFELADTVQLDQADNAVLAQLERVNALLAERQWDEAVEILRQVAESSEGKLLGVTSRRFIGLRDWCQRRLALLPSEALKLYRGRVDPVAKRWYEQGLAQRNQPLLQEVLQQAFASSYGDDALMTLGEMALESGDYAAARWHWERIAGRKVSGAVSQVDSAVPPPEKPEPGTPAPSLLARLVLASILEGATERAGAELAQFARLYPDARGRLGGREGKYADLLETLLVQSGAWPTTPSDPNWFTVGGSFARNKIAPRVLDVGATAWRVALAGKKGIGTSYQNDPTNPRSAPDALRDTYRSSSCPFHPLVVGNLVLVSDGQRILAVRLDNGKPAWGQTAAIYQSQLAGLVAPPLPPETLGTPQFTMTVYRDKLFARMGSPITGVPHTAAPAIRPGCLVCLDLAAEGRLLWKHEPEEGWALEGPPVADGQGVYVAMRRDDIRPRAFVGCLDAQSGRLRWRRFVCSAETPARGIFPETTQNLLTLCGDRLYYNTNLGAVAAVAVEDGRLLWVSLYPRARRGNLARLAPHWQRGLNPCLWHRGVLLVAPADTPRIFAIDAADGQALWQTGTEVEDAASLLGVTDQWLIAGGRKLYWISLKDEDRGRVKHVWPDGAETPGCGRGVLAGDCVLWTTRENLYILDQQTAQPRRVVDLAARGASGGNLLAAEGRLLIATETELIAIAPQGGRIQDHEALQIAGCRHDLLNMCRTCQSAIDNSQSAIGTPEDRLLCPNTTISRPYTN